MQKIRWIVAAGLIVLAVFMMIPTSSGAAAERQVAANLDEVAAVAIRAQERHEPLSPSDLKALVGRMTWPCGKVAYKPWVGDPVGPGKWVVWAEPEVHAGWLDRACVWRPEVRHSRYKLASWELEAGAQRQAYPWG